MPGGKLLRSGSCVPTPVVPSGRVWLRNWRDIGGMHRGVPARQLLPYWYRHSDQLPRGYVRRILEWNQRDMRRQL